LNTVIAGISFSKKDQLTIASLGFGERPRGSIKVPVTLMGPDGDEVSVTGLLDPGADVSCIQRSYLPRSAQLKPASFALNTATGGTMNPTGNEQEETVLQVRMKDLECPDVAPYVFEHLSTPLILGIDWLRSAASILRLSNNRRLENVTIVGDVRGKPSRRVIHYGGGRCNYGSDESAIASLSEAASAES
jgi:hypothetical protein